MVVAKAICGMTTTNNSVSYSPNTSYYAIRSHQN